MYLPATRIMRQAHVGLPLGWWRAVPHAALPFHVAKFPGRTNSLSAAAHRAVRRPGRHLCGYTYQSTPTGSPASTWTVAPDVAPEGTFRRASMKRSAVHQLSLWSLTTKSAKLRVRRHDEEIEVAPLVGLAPAE